MLVVNGYQYAHMCFGSLCGLHTDMQGDPWPQQIHVVRLAK